MVAHAQSSLVPAVEATGKLVFKKLLCYTLVAMLSVADESGGAGVVLGRVLGVVLGRELGVGIVGIGKGSTLAGVGVGVVQPLLPAPPELILGPPPLSRLSESARSPGDRATVSRDQAAPAFYSPRVTAHASVTACAPRRRKRRGWGHHHHDTAVSSRSRCTGAAGPGHAGST